MADHPDAAKMKFWGVVLIAVILLVVWHNVSEYFHRGKARPVDKGSIAYRECRTAIRQKLKAPSSADFQPESRAHYIIAADTVIVTSFVDAQNSYGAKLRSSWRCKALVGDAGWFVVYATLLD